MAEHRLANYLVGRMATPLRSLRDKLIQNILKGTRDATQEAGLATSDGATPVGTIDPSPKRKQREDELEEELDELARPGAQVEQP
mgnify:CR=1 FL=1